MIHVRAAKHLRFGTLELRCTIGRTGMRPAASKREGDGASPMGTWRLWRVLYRADRVRPPPSRLPLSPLRPEDGWCDAPDHPAYNRKISWPFAASAEALWRDDHVYDYVGILSHNGAGVVPGAGSAIFLHLARPDWAPTEGCVAMARDSFEYILARAPANCAVVIGEPAQTEKVGPGFFSDRASDG